MKKYKFILPLVSLTTIAPLASVVACNNAEKNKEPETLPGGTNTVNTKIDNVPTPLYQGKTFTLPTNLTLGMDLLVEDGKGHMNDISWKYSDDTGEHDGEMAGQADLMDAVFLPGRSGVAIALGATPGTSMWNIMLQKLQLDPAKTKYEDVKKDVKDALASADPRKAVADVIAKYNLPIDTKTFELGGNFGNAAGIARMMLNVSNNLYNTFVYGFGYLIGLNQPIPVAEIKTGKVINSPNPFIHLKIAEFEEPVLKVGQTVEWIIKEVKPATAAPTDGTPAPKDGSLKIELNIKDSNNSTIQKETFEITGFSDHTE